MNGSEAGAAGAGQRRRRRRWLVLAAVLVALAAVGAFTAIQARQAFRHASAGKRALLAAERALRAEDLSGARARLAEADGSFEKVETSVDRLGPIAVVARQVPLVRSQVRGVETFAASGRLLAEAGMEVADAAEELLEPEDASVAAALTQLQDVQVAMARAEVAVEEAADRIDALAGRRLLGPLEDARRDLADRLPRAREETRSLNRGLAAFLSFTGKADGSPRRYLLLSQNPDELRPTGGFIGTYGVLSLSGDGFALDRYASIESWYLPRPDVVVPVEETPTPFRLQALPKVQNLANVNAVADWPTSAQLAARLWEQGGEEPVDGVIGFLPELLARFLSVLGPVEVPDFGEVVTAGDVVAKIDFYTHGEAGQAVPDADRKLFVAATAEAVLDRLVDASPSDWREVARRLGVAFEHREIMAWSRDDALTGELARRGWAGVLPSVEGDFFYGGEFAYASKNGRGLRRTYDHRVVVRSDGSGEVRTTVTVTNPQPREPVVNDDTLVYLTAHGPGGARLAGGDEPTSAEGQVRGHPAVGFDRVLPPEGEVSYTVVWEVPELLVEQKGVPGYELTWLPVAGAGDDVLELTVELPAGWRWRGEEPPASLDIGGPPVSLRWELARSN